VKDLLLKQQVCNVCNLFHVVRNFLNKLIRNKR